MDDDWLQKVDLEAIIAQAAKVSKGTAGGDLNDSPREVKILDAKQPEPNASDSEFQVPDLPEKKSASNLRSHVPPLLKLHPPKKIPVLPSCHFLPPVSDSDVDDNHFKR